MRKLKEEMPLWKGALKALGMSLLVWILFVFGFAILANVISFFKSSL